MGPHCMLLVLMCSLNAFAVRPDTFLPLVATANASSSLQVQSSIWKEIEGALSDETLLAMANRIAGIEHAIRPLVAAMPKRSDGKLLHAAVRYVLHRHLSEQHTWRIRGLADDGRGFASAGPQQILEGQVDDSVIAAFERRLNADGLGLHEIAVFVATFEGLVHQETLQRLNSTFKILRLYRPKQLNAAQVDRVLQTYMLGYVKEQKFQTMSTTQLNKSFDEVRVKYPHFNETQQYLSEARARNGANKTVYTIAEVEALVEDVRDQYGLWQDRECQDIKRLLMSLEDKSIGTNGSGRVRLADFYKSAAEDGNWQFSETEEYLGAIGALDDSDPSSPRVIIPNYIFGMSNCVAKSSLYDICCIDECESLMGSLERQFLAPSAAPAEIAEFIASMPSSTVQAGRLLPPTLLAKLEEISKLHNGQVPLHGRLFAQWMHFLYPRECSFPHLTGTTEPQRIDAWVRKTKRMPKYDKKSLPRVAKEYMDRLADGEPRDDDEQCMPWSGHEELYVEPPGRMTTLLRRIQKQFRSGVHLAMCIGAVSAFAVHLGTTYDSAIYADYELGKGKGFIV